MNSHIKNETLDLNIFRVHRLLPIILIQVLAVLFLLTIISTAYGQADQTTITVRLTKEAYQEIAEIQTVHAIDYNAFVWLELTPSGFEDLRTSGVAFEIQQDSTVLRFQDYSFDTRLEEPLIPSLQRSNYTPGSSNLFVAQLIGPTKDEWLDELINREVEILQYYKPYAYLVRMTPEQSTVIEELEFIRWVGEYHAAYRISSSLLELSGSIENVNVMIYDDGQMHGTVEQTIDAIENLGGMLVTQEKVRATTSFVGASFVLPRQSLEVIAQLTNVISLDYVLPEWLLEDEISNQIVAGNYNPIQPGYQDWLSTMGLDGSGVTVSLVDTGYDTGDVDTVHPDLRGRIIPVGTISDTNGHGTHVGGIIAGNGSFGITDTNGFLMGLGVAPNANLVVRNFIGSQPDLQRDSVINGAVASNNSYTVQAAGSGYTSVDSTIDQLVRDADLNTNMVADPLIIVFSAGNSGASGPTKEAKNIIAVGNSTSARDVNGDPTIGSSNIDSIEGDSSRGPTGDGRIYPHVTAPGRWIVSTHSSVCTGTGDSCVNIADSAPNDDPTYSVTGGTSMAAPHVTGAVALITEWWRDTHAGLNPSPAMAKALLVNGAVDIGTPDIPNGNEGWGRINLTNVVSPSVPTVYIDQTTIFTDTGQTWSNTFIPADPNLPVKVTLAWTDAPGPGSGGNPASLVNDLDLTVGQAGTTYLGNDFANGFSTTGGTADQIDNLENVFIQNPAGSVFRVTVQASGINGDGIPYNMDNTDQDFAIVIQNAIPVNVDVVLIIDSSGSMTSNDPANRRLDAAKAYLTASAAGDFVGVVDFDSGVRLASPVLELPDNKDSLIAAIDTIDSSGGTNIGIGVQEGCEALLASTSENDFKAAILLTDGVGSFANQHTCFGEQGWPIFTFGFGNADEILLQDIAESTGGEFRFLPPSNLVCEFQAVRAKIAGAEPEACTALNIDPGQTITLLATVPPGQGLATFSTSWAGSDVVMSLASPTGRVIDRNTTDPDVTHDLGDTFEVYSVTNPEPGDWEVTLFGADIPPEGEEVIFGFTTLPASGESKIVMIDIMPGVYPNQINPASRGSVQVAILSEPGFDAVAEVNRSLLTFGQTGDEDSLRRQGRDATPRCFEDDVDDDSLVDLVCHFIILDLGFELGDTIGFLKGETMDGTVFEGNDSVVIISRFR